jgi:hypothetical protein
VHCEEEARRAADGNNHFLEMASEGRSLSDFNTASSPEAGREGLKLLLDYEHAARALSLTRAALRDLVYKGRGPAITKIGRRTLFAIIDLEEFVNRHRQAAVIPVIAEATARKRRRGRPTIAEQMARDACFAK